MIALAKRSPASSPPPLPSQDLEIRRRVNRLLKTEIAFIANPSFRAIDEELEQAILGDNGLVPSEPAGNSPRDLPSHLARLCDGKLLSPAEEGEMFRQMNYLKCRANAIRSRLDPNCFDLETVEKAERMLAAAEALRNRIVQANMRLVISIVKKFVTPQWSFDDLLSDGTISLMQAVEKFDYDRGFRFSTYAYRSIVQNTCRAIKVRQKEKSRFAGPSDESIFEALDPGSQASMSEQTWESLRGLLAQMMDQLDRRERLILRARYALGSHRKVKTCQSLADRLGVSKERIRQLEQRAINKLRLATAQLDLSCAQGAPDGTR